MKLIIGNKSEDQFLKKRDSRLLKVKQNIQSTSLKEESKKLTRQGEYLTKNNDVVDKVNSFKQ